MPNLVETIKIAAVQAVEAGKPAGVYFGTVTAINPLEIEVEQKFTLSQEYLVLSTHVVDHYVDMTVDHVTEPASISITEEDTGHNHGIPAHVTEVAEVYHTHPSESEDEATGPDDTAHSHGIPGWSTERKGYSIDKEHIHGYVGRKTFLVHYGLEVGEKVILIRLQGGQRYLVLDRVRDA